MVVSESIGNSISSSNLGESAAAVTNENDDDDKSMLDDPSWSVSFGSFSTRS